MAEPSIRSSSTVVRVVKFGLHAPSKRKQAMLEDALRRQTIAYGRALAAARPFAVEQLKVQTQMALAHNKAKEARDALRLRERAAITGIAGVARHAARGAKRSSVITETYEVSS